MTIPLAPALLTGSSNLPGNFGRAVLRRFPIWSCSVWGFACHVCRQPRGALLPHLFTLTHLVLGSSSLGHSRLEPRGWRLEAIREMPQAPSRKPQAGCARRPEGPRARASGIFSVPLVRRVSPPGRYPAHCSVEFGLSSPVRTSPRCRNGYDRQRSSGQLQH
jgi:hypothetical protein